MNINTNFLNTKKGFTLAETLLTIMIIGVLMALMLRTIIRVNPDKDKILFIKAYHAVETAVSNIINDSTKYNQTYLSEEDRTSGEYDLHHDFRDAPYPEATVNYISGGTQKTKTNISRAAAVCYFMVDQLNTLGDVNCDSNTGITVGDSKVIGANFRTSNGVCFDNWYGVTAAGQVDGVIDPNCEGASSGYVVRVFKDGKITVPSTSTSNANQSKAYEWLQKQAEIK